MNRPHLHALAPELESFAAEPYYQPVGREVELFRAAASKKLPVLLDVRDESTDDCRIVCELRKDADPQLVAALATGARRPALLR